MGVLKYEKEIRYRKLSISVGGLSRDEELIGRLQWSIEVSSFFLPFCVKLSAVAAACNLLAQISVQRMKKTTSVKGDFFHRYSCSLAIVAVMRNNIQTAMIKKKKKERTAGKNIAYN